jgi:hypothetical protein
MSMMSNLLSVSGKATVVPIPDENHPDESGHALELVVDLERNYQRKKAANTELIELIKTTGTGVIDLHGIGPSGAARLLVEVGDVTRFPDRGHFASWTGTAPIGASSGDRVRHRLSGGGNRQINMVLHMMAVVQLRNPTEGRAYYDRKVAAGKSPNEAMRCRKRRLSDIVYRTMLNELVTSKATGPGGHRGDQRLSQAVIAIVGVPGQLDLDRPVNAFAKRSEMRRPSLALALRR